MFVLFPMYRLLVREPLRCFPEFGDSRLLAEIVTNLWPFRELEINEEMLCSGELKPSVHNRVVGEGVESIIWPLDIVEEESIILVF